MTAPEHPALQAYRARQQSLLTEQQGFETRRGRMRGFIAACLAGVTILYDQAAHHGAHAWPILIPAAALAAIIPAYLGLQSKLARIQRLQVFYDRNLARADGSEPQSGHTGEALRPATHLHERDLNILGPDSLFGLLATVRTGIGQSGLARYLLEAATHEESQARQQAVRELAPNLQLREEIALLGSSRFQEVHASIFDAWLDDPPPTFHPAIRYTLVVTGLLLALMLLAGLAHLAPWSVLRPNLAAVAAIQAGVCMMVRKRVLPILAASKVAGQMQMFADGLALMQAQAFRSPKLSALQRLCGDGKESKTIPQRLKPDSRQTPNGTPEGGPLSGRKPVSAVAAINQIQSQFVIVEQRTKEYFFIFSLLLAAGTHAAISIAMWKREYAAPMKLWLAAWAEFEALNALATYAFENPHNVYPTLLPPTEPAAFEALTLGHPLLPATACVTNDVALNAATRFYLISGSNMAGKSTLLRSIGINAVLASAGAPVRASECRLTPLTLAASLALTDSLAEGKSKFLAEVERLQLTLAASARTPTLFLIDEIFSGTNSTDRHTAAAAVLRQLLANGAIGALSTHDLALTELATPEAHGINLHMASPNPDDPLGFDYVLKEGVNRSSNALAIIRMMGIETRE